MSLIRKCFWMLCSVIALSLSCAKDPGPPPPLAADQIPAALDKAFNQAKQESKGLVSRITTALQAKDYADAYDAVQALMRIPDSTKEQRSTTSRALLTIYNLLQDAQAQGDDKAAAAIRYYKSTK